MKTPLVKKLEYLSRNPTLTFEIVQNNPDYAWDWHGISENKNITLEMIESYPELPWEYGALSRNPNIPWSFVAKNLDKKWHWYDLTKIAPLDFILRNSYFGWSWCGVFKTFKLEDKIVKNILEKGYEISTRADWRFIMDHPNWPWRWDFVSQNPSVTTKVIEDYPDGIGKKWNWAHISHNENIDVEFVKKNLDKNWNWDGLTTNKKISIQDILDNPTLNWDLKVISENPNMKLEQALKCESVGLSVNWGNVADNDAENFWKILFDRRELVEGDFFGNYSNISPEFDLQVAREYFAVKKIERFMIE